jgi:hypothetical protein
VILVFKHWKREARTSLLGSTLVYCTEVIAPGKRVLAEIFLANGTWVEPIGRVAWARKGSSGEHASTRLGIEFLAEVPEVVAGLAAQVRVGAHQREQPPVG